MWSCMYTALMVCYVTLWIWKCIQKVSRKKINKAIMYHIIFKQSANRIPRLVQKYFLESWKTKNGNVMSKKRLC